ncbi:hypothetical protein GCM10023228_17860 [Brevibacillus fulvus]
MGLTFFQADAGNEAIIDESGILLYIQRTVSFNITADLAMEVYSMASVFGLPDTGATHAKPDSGKAYFAWGGLFI